MDEESAAKAKADQGRLTAEEPKKAEEAAVQAKAEAEAVAAKAAEKQRKSTIKDFISILRPLPFNFIRVFSQTIHLITTKPTFKGYP